MPPKPHHREPETDLGNTESFGKPLPGKRGVMTRMFDAIPEKVQLVILFSLLATLAPKMAGPALKLVGLGGQEAEKGGDHVDNSKIAVIEQTLAGMKEDVDELKKNYVRLEGDFNYLRGQQSVRQPGSQPFRSPHQSAIVTTNMSKPERDVTDSNDSFEDPN